MNEIFSFKEPSYHFRIDNIFVRNNDRTMTYGTKTIYLLGSNLTLGTVYQENKKLNHYINLKKKKKFKLGNRWISLSLMQNTTRGFHLIALLYNFLCQHA